MGKFSLSLLISAILFALFISSASAQSCTQQSFSSNRVFSTCSDLPYLNSFLHWTFNPSSQSLQIAFRRTGMTPSTWVAWAINPSSAGMLGSQALVAFQKSDGTMRAYTSPVSSYQTGLRQGDLSFPVSDLSATYSNNEITIFATLKLHNISSASAVNHVWQEGPVSNDSPGMHSTTGQNVQSMGSLNLLSGEAKSTAGGVDSRIRKKNVHGFLNSVSWGILMPLGAIIARYVKVFPSADPAWFYLHVCCQFSAYVVGVAGFATGLQLGSQSAGITYIAHRVIGILLFTLATVQLFALLLRPKKDNKYRIYWNLYHYSVGYSILILGIINVFKGLHILNPEKKWENAYIAVLVILAALAVVLEAVTWIIVLRRKRSTNANSGKVNGANGVNGYGSYGV